MSDEGRRLILFKILLCFVCIRAKAHTEHSLISVSVVNAQHWMRWSNVKGAKDNIQQAIYTLESEESTSIPYTKWTHGMNTLIPGRIAIGKPGFRDGVFGLRSSLQLNQLNFTIWKRRTTIWGAERRFVDEPKTCFDSATSFCSNGFHRYLSPGLYAPKGRLVKRDQRKEARNTWRSRFCLWLIWDSVPHPLSGLSPFHVRTSIGLDDFKVPT